MLKDIKKMQSEAEKIQKHLEASDKLRINIGEFLTSGKRSLLYGVSIPLAGINHSQDSGTEAMSIVAITEDNMDIESIHSNFNKIPLTLLNTAYRMQHPDNVLKGFEISLYEKISKLSDEILDKLVGKQKSHWTISIGTVSGADIDVEDGLLMHIIEALRVVVKEINEEKLIISPVVYFETFEDIVALNLIKIVQKGTDTIDTQYIGKCLGISIEALIFVEDEIKQSPEILKKYKKIFHQQDDISNELRCEAAIIGYGHDQLATIFESDIQCLDIDRNLCSHLMAVRYSNENSLLSLEAARMEVRKSNSEECAKARDCAETEDGAKPVWQPNVNKETITFKKTSTYTPSFFTLVDTHKLMRLIIAKGKDLSNSFKAKYI